MTAQTDLTRDEIIARNLEAVEVHFHNENVDSIDQAISVYTDDIVWEVPARGLVLRNVEDVKQEYLKIFGSMTIHKIINLHRFATEEWVFDDSIFEWTMTGDGFRNAPLPVGDDLQHPSPARVPDAGRDDLPRARLRDLAGHQRHRPGQRRHPRQRPGRGVRLTAHPLATTMAATAPTPAKGGPTEPCRPPHGPP